MNIKFNYENFPKTPAIEALLEKKFKKSERLFNDRNSQVNVIMKKDGKNHVLKLQLIARDEKYFARVSSSDMYNTLDDAVDNIKRQVKSRKATYKTNSKNKRKKLRFEETQNNQEL